MDKGTGRRGMGPRRTKNKKIILTLLILFIIIIASLTGYSLSVNGTVKEWDQKIYSGVTIHDIDVGGMTKDEARVELIQKLQGSIGDKKLPIKIGDKDYELIYSEISPTYNIDEAVDKAYVFGKDAALFKKYYYISNRGSNKHKVDLGFSYDEEKLKAYEEKLKNEVNQSPKNATLVFDNNGFSISDEVQGKSISIETLDEKLKEVLNGHVDDEAELVIDLETVRPKITKEDLSKINGIIGSYSSDYGSSPAGRSNNIELATKAINGTIIMPGEEFSFNEIVGPRTVERGYQEAATYVANKVEPGIGGGICQVSTALYRAVMHANIRPIERRNHSMSVGYAKPGLDATVSYGDIDYKFKNTYDFPIYIQGNIYNKVMTYSIYGNVEALNGKKYDMESEIIQTIPPEVKVINDPSLPEGKEVSEGGGITGYRANSYQITYENGLQTSKELIGTDYYASVDATVRKGTAPLTPVVPPTADVPVSPDASPAPEAQTSQTPPPVEQQAPPVPTQ
ncbi:VanW family protein [Clostridium weizhouense]|nr:VanW family protein [Clostridium weizhouense]